MSTPRPVIVQVAVPGLLAAIVIFSLVLSQWDTLRGYAESPSTELVAMEAKRPSQDDGGQIRFVYDDLGSLNTDVLQTHAIPWKIVSTALLLHADAALTPERLHAKLREFGFIKPRSVANWQGSVELEPFARPIGILSSQLRRSLPPVEMEIANIGCAACHAGTIYDSAGTATGDVWIGLPNTSLDLEAFTTAVFESLKSVLPDRIRLIDGIATLHPHVSDRERATIADVLLPRIEERIGALDASLGRPVPYSNGYPGTTNGVGALKWVMGLLVDDASDREVGFTSIPDLGGTLFRTSLLYDGTYTARGQQRFRPMTLDDVDEDHTRGLASIVAFFTVPSMGVAPHVAEAHIPQTLQILTFLGRYEPPPFPGPIDTELAGRGREIYEGQCAQCHGLYSGGSPPLRLISFPNRLVPQAALGTDSARWQPDPMLIPVLRETSLGDHIDAASTGGYVAPVLTGLWATAPYLHNGSVPTLWHLMRPEQRPARFYVGGHRLDYEKVGIDGTLGADGVYRYPAGFEPWSTPALIDATRPGLTNVGHEREFTSLADSEKRALLEFLKRL